MKNFTLSIIVMLCFSINLSAQCDSTLPISENFDTNVINVCWNVADSDGDSNNWYWWEYSAYYGGHKVISSNSFYTSSGALTPDNWIISHAIDLTSYNTSNTIELSWKVRGELSGFSHEYYTVYAATANSISALQASSVKRGEYVDEVGGAGNFVTRTLDLSPLAGNIAYIAFRHHNSTNQYNINIDDVGVSTSSLNLSSEEFQEKNFHHFYDSNSDILTLKSTISNFKNIQIYNLMGQKVLESQLSDSIEKIGLSNLVDGIYIVQIGINDATKAIKFLKH